MRRILFLVVMIMLFCSVSYAADSKDTLLLKQRLYTEQMQKYQAQLKAVQLELADAYKKAESELMTVNKELKVILDAEKKAAEDAKKAAEKKQPEKKDGGGK